MYSGVAIENCLRFVNRNELPKSISFTALMKLTSRSSSDLFVLNNIFSVLRSEWTILWLFIKNNALETSIKSTFNSFWSALIRRISSLYSIYISIYILCRTSIHWELLLSVRKDNCPKIHHKVHNTTMNQ